MKFNDFMKSRVNMEPVPFLVEEIKLGIQTKYGTKILVTFSMQGVAYEWWMSEPQYARQIASTGIKVGDMVFSTSKMGDKGVLIDVVKTSGVQSPTVVTPQPIVGVNTPTAQSIKQDENAFLYDIRQNRIGLSSILIELIKSGKHDVNACKLLSLELFEWVTAQAKTMAEAQNEQSL